MSFSIEVKEEAKQDIADAMYWYGLKAKGLDKKFLKAVEDAILRIQRNPFAFKRVYKKFRQTAVKKFPYVIVYEPESTIVVIYSVFNTWQHQKRKFQRIKR